MFTLSYAAEPAGFSHKRKEEDLAALEIGNPAPASIVMAGRFQATFVTGAKAIWLYVSCCLGAHRVGKICIGLDRDPGKRE